MLAVRCGPHYFVGIYQEVAVMRKVMLGLLAGVALAASLVAATPAVADTSSNSGTLGIYPYKSGDTVLTGRARAGVSVNIYTTKRPGGYAVPTNQYGDWSITLANPLSSGEYVRGVIGGDGWETLVTGFVGHPHDLKTMTWQYLPHGQKDLDLTWVNKIEVSQNFQNSGSWRGLIFALNGTPASHTPGSGYTLRANDDHNLTWNPAGGGFEVRDRGLTTILVINNKTGIIEKTLLVEVNSHGPTCSMGGCIVG